VKPAPSPATNGAPRAAAPSTSANGSAPPSHQAAASAVEKAPQPSSPPAKREKSKKPAPARRKKSVRKNPPLSDAKKREIVSMVFNEGKEPAEAAVLTGANSHQIRALLANERRRREQAAGTDTVVRQVEGPAIGVLPAPPALREAADAVLAAFDLLTVARLTDERQRTALLALAQAS